MVRRKEFNIRGIEEMNGYAELVYHLCNHHIPYKVYKIVDGKGNLIYIGCTSLKLSIRLSCHISQGRNETLPTRSKKHNFFNMVANGTESAEIILIKQFNNPFEASALESSLIKKYSATLLNGNYRKYCTQYAEEWFMWMKNRGGKRLINRIKDKFIDRHRKRKDEIKEFVKQRSINDRVMYGSLTFD